MRRQPAVLPRIKPRKTTCCSRSTGNSPGATSSATDTRNSWAGTADNRGLLIGTVTRYDRARRTVTITPDHPVSLHPGDGLLFTLQNHPAAAWGYALNSEPDMQNDGMIVLSVSRPALEGSRVFLTSSQALAARARDIGSQAPPDLRHPVPIDMVATVAADGHLTLAGTIHPPGKEPVIVENTSDLHLVPARSRPLSEETLAAQLTKTGGTPFGIADLSLSYDGTLFTPVSEINRYGGNFSSVPGRSWWHRTCPYRKCGASEKASRNVYRRTSGTPGTRLFHARKNPGLPEKIHEHRPVRGQHGRRGCRYPSGAKTICFEPPGFPYPSGVDAESENARIEAAVRTALDICRAHDARLIWKLPRITRQFEITAIRSVLPRLYAAGLRACMVENPGTALAVEEAAPGLALPGSWGLNVFNAETVRVFAREHFTILPGLPGIIRKRDRRTCP